MPRLARATHGVLYVLLGPPYSRRKHVDGARTRSTYIISELQCETAPAASLNTRWQAFQAFASTAPSGSTCNRGLPAFLGYSA